MRKRSVYVLLAGVAVTMVFAALGDTIAFSLSAVGLAVTGVVHWRLGCTRCTNMACAINPCSPDSLFRSGDRSEVAEDVGFSDLRSAVLGAPVLLAYAVGVYGAWRFHPFAAAVPLAVIAVGFAAYYRATCAHCTNDCPANHNPAYRRWKSAT